MDHSSGIRKKLSTVEEPNWVTFGRKIEATELFHMLYLSQSISGSLERNSKFLAKTLSALEKGYK